MSRKQEFIFHYLLMNTVMCVFMALAGLLVNVGTITWKLYSITLLQSLVICNLTNVVFRLPKLGRWLMMRLSGGRPESRAFQVWGAIINPTLNSFCMTTFMTLLNVGFRPVYFAAWLHGFPALEVVSLVVSFFAAPVSRKIAMKF